MKALPRCVAQCNDGSGQCSRRVADGSHPPLCHLHRAKPNLSPLIPPPEDVDELKLLKRLAHDRDSKVRLRALDMLLKRKEKAETSCATCAERAERDRVVADDMSRMTDEQKDDLRVLCARIRQLREVARTQPVRPQEEF